MLKTHVQVPALERIGLVLLAAGGKLGGANLPPEGEYFSAISHQRGEYFKSVAASPSYAATLHIAESLDISLINS